MRVPRLLSAPLVQLALLLCIGLPAAFYTLTLGRAGEALFPVAMAGLLIGAAAIGSRSRLQQEAQLPAPQHGDKVITTATAAAAQVAWAAPQSGDGVIVLIAVKSENTKTVTMGGEIYVAFPAHLLAPLLIAAAAPHAAPPQVTGRKVKAEAAVDSIAEALGL